MNQINEHARPGAAHERNKAPPAAGGQGRGASVKTPSCHSVSKGREHEQE